jgi:hypothetical protein
MRHPTALLARAGLLCLVAAPLPPLPTGRRQLDDPAVNPLTGVPALPKVHHSWPLAVNFTDPAMRPVLEDYARITHAVAAGALFWTPTQAVVDGPPRQLLDLAYSREPLISRGLSTY